MATESRITGDGELRANPALSSRGGEAEPGLGELFKELAQDSSTLIKQEMALARAEMQESLRTMTRGVLMLAVGGGILLVGLLALTAFLIVALGDALDNYWLGALIVGVAYAALGGVLLMRGKSDMSAGELKPQQTIESLKEDKRWAQAEAQQVKRDLKS